MRISDQVFRTRGYIFLIIVAHFFSTQGEADAHSPSVISLTSNLVSFQQLQISNQSNLQFFNADSLYVPLHNNASNQSEIFISPTNNAKNVHSILSASSNVGINDDLNSQTTVGVNRQYANILIRVHGWESVQIDEGTSEQFQISLRAEPSSDVQITVSQLTTAGLSHSQSTPLTFTISNYNTPQPVTVTAAKDANTVHESERIILTASGAEYDGMTKSFLVQVLDVDVSGPRIMMDPSNTLSLNDHNEKHNHAFRVWLSEKPDADVTVTIAPFDNPDVTIKSSSTLTFTPQNYSEKQVVSIGSECDYEDDDESAHTLLAASGGGYDGVMQPYRIAITDRCHVIPGHGFDYDWYNSHDLSALTVKEGTSNTFKVWLRQLPSSFDLQLEWYTGKLHNYSLPWECAQPPASIVTFQPSTLTFTPFNYGTKQEVTVTAKVDDNAVDETYCLYMHGAFGNVLRVYINDKDNVDGAEIIVSPRPGRRKVDEGRAMTLSVRLLGKPLGDVSVEIPAFDNDDLTHDRPNPIKFTPSNYTNSQHISVRSIKDKTADDEHGDITLTASGGGYDGITKDVRVKINDLDDRRIIAEDTIRVQEGTVNVEDFGIFLATQPTGRVQVSITGNDASKLTLSTESVVFTENETSSTSDWNDPKIVELTAATDTGWKDDEILLTLTATGSDYNNITKDVLIIIVDPDPAPSPAIVLTPSTVDVDEGSNATFEVTLSVEPTKLVKVKVPAFQTAGLRHDKPDSLEFTPTTYDNPQNVTVTSTEDANSISESEEIELSATGAEYDGQTATLTANVIDKDSDGLILPSLISMTITEGTPSDELSVRLSQEPTGSVTVTVSREPSSNLNEPVPPTIEFDALDYGSQKSIRLAAPSDDNLIIGPPETITLTASGGGYDGVDTTVTVTFTDPDEPKIIAQSTLTVPEGQFNTLDIRLSHQPSGDVEISIPNVGDLTATPPTLPFTDSNWDTDQSVTLNAAEDADSEDDTETLTLTASSGGYDGITENITITITDDDPPVVIPTVTLSVDPTNVTENSTTRVTATLSEAVSTATIIELEYEDIDTEPSDYTPLQRLTIAAGALSSSGDLRILDDEISEPDETFRVRLVKPEGVDLGTPSFVDVTIQDDDTPPPTEVILEVDRTRLNEGESVQVTVTLNDALEQAVTIPLDYPTDGASAEANLDYTPLPELTIAAGQTTQSGTIETLTDALQEGDETFTVALGALPSEVVGGRILSHTITILDRTSTPNVSLYVDRNSVDEGQQTNVEIVLSGPVSSDVTIPVVLTSGSASINDDVEELTTLFPLIASGETEAQVLLRAVEDDLIEGSETFTVALGTLPPTVEPGTPSTIEITINDNDVAHIIAPASEVVREGAQETIQVSLTAIPSSSVSIEITGYVDTDLGVSPNELMFTPDDWDEPQNVTLTAEQDEDILPDDISLLLTASGGEYSGVTHTVEVTIIDGDQPGLVVPASLEVNEGASESFDVRLSKQPTGEVTVMMTGTAGSDLDLDRSVLTFTESDWDQPQPVELTAQNDPDAVQDDPVQLMLNASGGGYDGVSETLIVRIIETDQIGIVVDPRSLRIEEGGSDALSVVLTSQPSANVSVSVTGYETTDLKVPTSLPLTFTPSDWNSPQEISLIADTDSNTDNEEVTLSLRASGGGYDGQTAIVQVTIVDLGLPKITIYDGQAKESDGIIRLNIELSHSTDQPITVEYTSADETATAPEDYISSRGIVIFDPDSKRGIVQFQIKDDEVREDTETFTVTLAKATNAEIARRSATATIIDDDGGVPNITIQDATASEEDQVITFHLHLSQPSPEAISIAYRTEDGTATAGQDYSPQSGLATFAAGAMQTQIDIPLIQKQNSEDQETFYLHLESSKTAQMDKTVATAVIRQETEPAHNAMIAYTARFVRTLSVQLTEALQERLQPSESTCSAAHRLETAQLWHTTSPWTPSLGELLSGCHVSKTEQTSTGAFGVWGRGAFRRFHGRQDITMTLRGDVSTAMIGTDYRWTGGWLAGVMLAHGQATGSYQITTREEADAQLTGIYPYVSYQTSAVEVWMSGGYGWGHAEVPNVERDLTSRFGAIGFKADLISAQASQLKYYGDLFVTDADLGADRAEVIRVRLGVENAFKISEQIRPYVEANVRQDGGDTETGLGLEIGGGVRIAYPQWNLRGEVRSQGLVLHSADGFSEWGVSGSLQFGNPSEGFMMRVRPSWGPNQMGSLYRQQTILDATPYPSGMHRTEVELGYGIPMHRGTARSIVGLTELPRGRLVRLGGQLNPWDWMSLSISGLAHHRHVSGVDMSLNVRGTLQY
ncbi:MAG: autotransporter domain-containing protein [Bacteroidetes bacterium]|nr:autotransporter domain-containing protein [Bacteroidota bacterium]